MGEGECGTNEESSTDIYILLLLSRFSHVWLCGTPETAVHQAPHPWDSPGKNTGVGCHFLLQCMKVKSESEVAQSSPTLRDPMDCSLPGSSIHGIFQARVLEWGAIAFSTKFYSSILTEKISWTEEPGRLQSMRSQKSRTRLSDWACSHTSFPQSIPLAQCTPTKSQQSN